MFEASDVVMLIAIFLGDEESDLKGLGQILSLEYGSEALSEYVEGSGIEMRIVVVAPRDLKKQRSLYRKFESLARDHSSEFVGWRHSNETHSVH